MSEKKFALDYPSIPKKDIFLAKQNALLGRYPIAWSDKISTLRYRLKYINKFQSKNKTTWKFNKNHARNYCTV